MTSGAIEDVEVIRTVDGPPERVWTGFTQADELARWWWPVGFDTRYEIDCRPGGAFRFQAPNVPGIGPLELSGEFLKVIPPTRLTYSWRWESEPEAESRVYLELGELREGTEIRVTHAGLKNDSDGDNHRIGWNDCLDRLDLLLRRDS